MCHLLKSFFSLVSDFDQVFVDGTGYLAYKMQGDGIMLRRKICMQRENDCVDIRVATFMGRCGMDGC